MEGAGEASYQQGKACLMLLTPKHALSALGVVSSLLHQHEETRRGSSPGEFPPLSSEGFNMMSTSVSQRRSRKHRPTRATGPSIYPALISHKSCRKGTLHI